MAHRCTLPLENKYAKDTPYHHSGAWWKYVTRSSEGIQLNTRAASENTTYLMHAIRTSPFI